MSRRLTLLLSFAAGATVANLYYSQPLLARIAAEFHVASGAASVVTTATQLGYALGLLLLVPLGDIVERRRLIVATTACIVVALIFVAIAPSLPLLIAASALLGMATIVPQIVVPFAAHLASDDERGRVIGTVMSGVLIGVILSRSVSGFLAGSIGWRTTYLLAATAMSILAIVLWIALPVEEPEVKMRYGALLKSLAVVTRREPALRCHSIIGACGFGAFSVFWTTLAFHLQSLSPKYGPATVGAFGLIGVTGALFAPFAGRIADVRGPRVMNGGGLALMLIAYVLMAISGHSLVVLALGAILLDAGEQASHIANQTRIFGLGAEMRNRVNAVYMVAFFFGGALGSAMAGAAWQWSGWLLVCAAGCIFAVTGLAVLFVNRP